jgi:hypothetical protein
MENRKQKILKLNVNKMYWIHRMCIETKMESMEMENRRPSRLSEMQTIILSDIAIEREKVG